MSKIQITVLIIIITAVTFIFFLPFTAAQISQQSQYPQEDQMSLVTISTSAGDIYLELDSTNAPITVANFLKLAEDGYYNGTIFHRIIDGFMVQGGGLDKNMAPKPTGTEPIQNEANNGLKNDRGTLAMARTMDPHSATGQFFINHKDNDFLNHTAETAEGWGYAVFGAVINGMDVVDLIALSTTSTVGGYADAPLEPTIINSVTVSE
jgi:peptidyl-prolyl cis-trans isomerase B (cyclophilin B)